MTMKIIYTTDLHGNQSYYDQLAEVAYMAEADIVINGGDMLPKGGDMFEQGKFITGFLDQHMQESVYIIHMPPYGIGLDECRAGKRIVGSRALAKFLADNQPRYSLHGHIHESPQVSGKWQSPIGSTTCIQPGQNPKFTYVTIDTQSGTHHRTIS